MLTRIETYNLKKFTGKKIKKIVPEMEQLEYVENCLFEKVDKVWVLKVNFAFENEASFENKFKKYSKVLLSIIQKYEKKAEFELEVIEAGADEIDNDGEGTITVTTEFSDYGNMINKLAEMKIEPTSAEIVRIPKTTEKVSEEAARSVLKMIDILEDDDDVISVFHNMEVPEALLNEE